MRSTQLNKGFYFILDDLGQLGNFFHFQSEAKSLAGSNKKVFWIISEGKTFKAEKKNVHISSNEKIFNVSIAIYQEALIKAGYNHKLRYHKHDQKKDSPQQRKRQIIWFNPPYSKNVTTKVGQFFLSLIDKHFPPYHKMHKLFHRNNINISYSCLPNIKSVVNAYNRNMLYLSPTIGRITCNCINTPQCPLQQRCLSNNILYQASITPIGENSETKVYYGIFENNI